MRWNCPHCGAALAVSDEKLGTSWSFSRCYKCGGFALVRRSDINLIKVDKAPAGERVILPESTENLMMSKQATEHMSSITSEKPVIRPTVRQSVPTTPPMFNPKVETRGVTVTKPNIPAQSHLPDPLPEVPKRSSSRHVLPLAIGLACVVASGSGVYLYVQGQQLWQKAGSTGVQQEQQNPIRPASAQVRAQEQNEVVDEVHQNAMAPARTVEPKEPTAPASAMSVRTRTRSSLRAGPGLNYPVLGVSDAQAQYIVKEWKEEWFNVVIPEGAPQVTSDTQIRSAWIRNDLVELINN